ncbi:MAG: N-acetylmuramoyl-L-alanine amidase family protein [Bdellovibrionota bacterium]
MLWLLLLPLLAQAADWPWVVIDKTPYLTLGEWEKHTHFHAYVDEPEGRILLERKPQPDLMLLLNAPYALQGGRFLALPQAPIERGDQILLSLDSAERVLLPVLPEAERGALRQAFQEARGREQQGCLTGRTVQRIFLDPGHGGDDLGTKKAGIKEKDIVLKFSRLVADELRRRGFTVSFSRTRDVFVPLEIRPRLAKEWKADLFVSIHVNSSPSAAAQGTETYILNQEATDAEARKLALLENSIAGKADSKESAVQDILWDMEQTAYLQDSAYLASYIQKSIVENAHDLLRKKKNAGDWKNRGVRQAPFYVLNRAPMPAVLVEIGYLSNPKDRTLMGEKLFQESLAKALAEGVKKYKEACRKSP